MPEELIDASRPDSLEVLSQYFVGSATMHETLTRVAQLAVEALPGIAMCGVTVSAEATVDTHAFTDPEVLDIDRVQYETGEGPCLLSLMTGIPVTVESTATDKRFPVFNAGAREHGIDSVLAVPLKAAGETLGAMNLYAKVEQFFNAAEIRTASAYARQAAFVLANARAYWDVRALNEGLKQAMESRATIEQAKGIIMATAGVDPDTAFAKLVEQSQHENIKLRDLAAELVARADRRGRSTEL